MLPRSLRSALCALLLASLGALLACGGDSPAGPGNVLGNGPVTALVDGVAWTAVAAVATNGGGFIAVGASAAGGEGLGFAVQGTTTGTYNIGGTSPTNANYSIGGSSWVAGGMTGSGSIVITTLTSTRVAGTFAFEAVSLTGGLPATKSVTQGMFDVTF